MKIQRFIYFIVIAIFCLPTMGMEDKESCKIRMGIELELQGIEYDDLETVTPDHLRLFQGKDWYLEVDGSGNLEFVSEPFFLEAESSLKMSPLFKPIQQMHRLLAYIIGTSKEEKFYDADSQKEKIHFVFEEKKGKSFEDMGEWVLSPGKNNASLKEIEAIKKKTDIKLIIKDLTCRVRPQATFELPLHLIPQFTSYMANKHPKLNRIKNALIEKQYDSFTYLIGLYINFLKDKGKYEEAGPKEKFPLMSRKSFSSMYASLGKEIKLQEVFKEELDNKLFAIPYFIMFDGEDISENNEIYKKELETITIGNWISSIVDPSIGQKRRNYYKEFWNGLLEKKVEKDDEYELLTYQIKNLGLYDKTTDILSSPPFLDNNYSMGKYDDSSKPTAIVEMRGYTKAYGMDIRMGQLVLSWLEREVYNASRVWNPSKILTITNYNELYEQINDNIENSNWHKGEDHISKVVKTFKESEQVLINLEKTQNELNLSNDFYKNTIFKMNTLKALDCQKEDRKALDQNILSLISKVENDKREWVQGLLSSN